MTADLAQTSPGPAAPGWDDVRRAVITAADGCAEAVQILARRPGDRTALRMAALSAEILQDLSEITRRLSFDEAVVEAERARAADEALARHGTLRRVVLTGHVGLGRG